MRIKNKTLFVSLVVGIVTVALVAVGFAAWSGGTSSSSNETTLTIEVDEVQYAGFANLTSKKAIRFDAPIDDNSGKIVYTSDIGGEQLMVDVTGKVLNYSQVGSIEISSSIDSEHENNFNYVKSHKYINEPVFETLTRKPTVLNPSVEGSYWISDHDTVNDTRDFEIIASFSWGSFFAFENPSIFFDSINVNSDGLAGNEYDESTIKSILATIHELNHAIYTIHLAVTAFSYTVNYLSSDSPAASGLPSSQTIEPGGSFTIPSSFTPISGYEFRGYSYTKNNTSAEFTLGQTYSIDVLVSLDSTINTFNLYTVFEPKQLIIIFNSGSNGNPANSEVSRMTDKRYGQTITIPSAPTATSGYNFTNWQADSTHGSKTVSAGSSLTLTDANLNSISTNNTVTFTAQWEKQDDSCLLPDTLITLSNGSVKKAKEITLNDEIITFNHITGEYEPQHVIFTCVVGEDTYTIIKLTFDNGKQTEVACGHGFYNLTKNNYEIYYGREFDNHIGEYFATTDYINGSFKTVPAKLIKAEYSERFTEKYSPLSEYNINVVSDGVLTIADDIEGMLDALPYKKDMTIDLEVMQNDILKYGLYEYEDVKYVMPRYAYDVFNAKYFKIFIGKGKLTYDKINSWQAYLPAIIKEHNITDWDYESRLSISESN